MKYSNYSIAGNAGWLYVCTVKIDWYDRFKNPRNPKTKIQIQENPIQNPKKPKPTIREKPNPSIQRKPKLRICYQPRLTS